MSYKIYLVRHGQTILNRYNRMQGWCDSPLTQKGIEDAHEAGRRLKKIKFAYAFHSDTTRAMRTCNYILSENNNETPVPITLENFREQGYGYYEGSDSNQAWLMIGASHNCRTFKELISTYSIEDARDAKKPIRSTRPKTIRNFGNASEMVSNILTRLQMTAATF